MLLPNTLPIHLGNGQAGQDQDVRRARAGETSSRTNSGTNTGRTGRTGQPTGAEGSGYDHLAPPGAGVGIVRSGGSDTGGRPTAATPIERIDLPVDSSSSKSREAGQAERAAAPSAEEVTAQSEPIAASADVDHVEEWFAANPDKVENATSPLADGRVSHIFEDGRWIQHLGRDQVALRQPVEIALKAGQMVDFDKNGKAFVVPEKGKGRAD